MVDFYFALSRFIYISLWVSVITGSHLVTVLKTNEVRDRQISGIHQMPAVVGHLLGNLARSQHCTDWPSDTTLRRAVSCVQQV